MFSFSFKKVTSTFNSQVHIAYQPFSIYLAREEDFLIFFFSVTVTVCSEMHLFLFRIYGIVFSYCLRKAGVLLKRLFKVGILNRISIATLGVGRKSCRHVTKFI